MECVKGALKSSLRPETAVKTTHQAFLDDLCANSAQIGVSVDDSFVDGFLDFSDGGIEEGLFEEEEGELQRGNVKACSDSVFLLQQQAQQTGKDNTFYPSRAATFSVKDDFGSAHGSELSVPADDLADLEWLSHFVEDLPAEYPLTFAGGSFPEKLAGNGSEPETQVSSNPCFSIPVLTKARSKRARTGGRVWSLGPPSLTESSPSSSASSSSTSSPSPSKAWLIYAGLNQTAESFIGKPPHAKRPKRKQATEISGSTAQQPRRCSHCLVQKTPQWRAGPHGAKTLCNACGVRYKSGRLFPEYRPACSPTFSSNFHSNNHRKVLELRRKNESDSGMAPPVRSF